MNGVVFCAILSPLYYTSIAKKNSLCHLDKSLASASHLYENIVKLIRRLIFNTNLYLFQNLSRCPPLWLPRHWACCLEGSVPWSCFVSGWLPSLEGSMEWDGPLCLWNIMSPGKCHSIAVLDSIDWSIKTITPAPLVVNSSTWTLMAMPNCHKACYLFASKNGQRVHSGEKVKSKIFL